MLATPFNEDKTQNLMPHRQNFISPHILLQIC